MDLNLFYNKTDLYKTRATSWYFIGQKTFIMLDISSAIDQEIVLTISCSFKQVLCAYFKYFLVHLKINP